MKIEYDGRTWEFDVERTPVDRCEAVEKYGPFKGMGDWSNQLDAGNTRAVIALWWLMRRQAGEDPGPVSRTGPGFLPIQLLFAFNEAMKAEAEAEAAAAAAAAAAAEAEPDPTTPAASSPAPSAATPMTPAAAPAAPSLPG